MTLNSHNKVFSVFCSFWLWRAFHAWIALTWLEIDLDNLQTGTAKAVACLMSFAQITCYKELYATFNYYCVYVVVYDILSGKIEHKLEAHRACVRDVSWHPYVNNLVSSSVCIILFLIIILILLVFNFSFVYNVTFDIYVGLQCDIFCALWVQWHNKYIFISQCYCTTVCNSRMWYHTVVLPLLTISLSTSHWLFSRLDCCWLFLIVNQTFC